VKTWGHDFNAFGDVIGEKLLNYRILFEYKTTQLLITGFMSLEL
jgi:hypothetical protein